MFFRLSILFIFISVMGTLTASQREKHQRACQKYAPYRSQIYPKSGYLTSTITWSPTDGYYVIHPNDYLFYYPFPSDQWKYVEQEISWVTYDDSSWERGYWIDQRCHIMKENGLALMATCIQDLRSLCYRKWIDYERPNLRRSFSYEQDLAHFSSSERKSIPSFVCSD